MLEILKIDLFAKQRCATVSFENKQKKMLIQLPVFIIKIKRFHVFFVNQITIHTTDAIK